MIKIKTNLVWLGEKLLAKGIRIVMLISGALVVLLVRLVGPIYLIRFGTISAHSMGHFAFDPEYHLRQKKTNPSCSLDIFFLNSSANKDGRVANSHWEKMVRRHLLIINFSGLRNPIINALPRGSRHFIEVAMQKNGSKDLEGLFLSSSRCIDFTHEEHGRGREFLNSFGTTPSRKTACFIVRDGGYDEVVKIKGSYKHDFRNSPIEIFEPAMLKLAEIGYVVFRMGKNVQTPLDIQHPNIIDYAKKDFQSDFLDIWLMANCHLAVSSDCGLDYIPWMFGRPLAVINTAQVGPMISWADNVTVTPKKLWSRKERRLIGLREQIEKRYIDFSTTSEFERSCLEFQNLSPLEITQAVLEIAASTQKGQTGSDEDQELQARFWSVFAKWERFHENHSKIRSQIGPAFLRHNHRWFLDAPRNFVDD